MEPYDEITLSETQVKLLRFYAKGTPRPDCEDSDIGVLLQLGFIEPKAPIWHHESHTGDRRSEPIPAGYEVTEEGKEWLSQN